MVTKRFWSDGGLAVNPKVENVFGVVNYAHKNIQTLWLGRPGLLAGSSLQNDFHHQGLTPPKKNILQFSKAPSVAKEIKVLLQPLTALFWLLGLCLLCLPQRLEGLMGFQNQGSCSSV